MSHLPKKFRDGLNTPLQKRTQVRFWITLQIQIDYDNIMPRLPENKKIKVPQVGSLTKKFKKYTVSIN